MGDLKTEGTRACSPGWRNGQGMGPEEMGERWENAVGHASPKSTPRSPLDRLIPQFAIRPVRVRTTAQLRQFAEPKV